MGNYAEIITLDSQAYISDRKVIADHFPIYKTAPDGLNPFYENESLTGLYSYVTDQRIYLMQTPYNKVRLVSHRFGGIKTANRYGGNAAQELSKN